MIDIFLSASVPLPNRDRSYFETADVLAIREAIKSLVEIVLPVGRITCGGHPAITPLLALFVEQAGLDRDRLTIFQSRYFEPMFPKQNKLFHNVRTVDKIAGDEEASLLLMRDKMIRSRKFDAAVFIGGMEGVETEARLFRDIWSGVEMIPVASTGAAARVVFDTGRFPADLATNLTYSTLFRRHLLPKEH